jgi:hypothetical protein
MTWQVMPFDAALRGKTLPFYLHQELCAGADLLRDKPDGSEVTTEEFQQFVDEKVVTPRFSDGLTLLMGLGQFRGSSGVIVQERSMLLILLYPVETRQDSSMKIEQIREAYKQLSQQESVLRADRGCEKVGF